MRITTGIARTMVGTLLALGVGAAAGPLHAASVDAGDADLASQQFAAAYAVSEDQIVIYTGEPVTATSGMLGDMNHDGVVNSEDISPFVLALTNSAAYEALFGIAPDLMGDINQDGAFDTADVAGFVHLLANGGGGGSWDVNGDASGSGVHAIPLPASVWAGLGLLGVVGAARVLRRRIHGVTIA